MIKKFLNCFSIAEKENSINKKIKMIDSKEIEIPSVVILRYFKTRNDWILIDELISLMIDKFKYGKIECNFSWKDAHTSKTSCSVKFKSETLIMCSFEKMAIANLFFNSVLALFFSLILFSDWFWFPYEKNIPDIERGIIDKRYEYLKIFFSYNTFFIIIHLKK